LSLPHISLTKSFFRFALNHGLHSLASPSAIKNCKSNIQEQSNKRAREQYANMSVEKKETYLKKRRDNYHKQKAIMEASTAITEASAAEGFHLDSSKSKPRFMNVHNQSTQPSMEMSQITNA
jgi:hypothetical protein